jgi:Helicase associated domain
MTQPRDGAGSMARTPQVLTRARRQAPVGPGCVPHTSNAVQRSGPAVPKRRAAISSAADTSAASSSSSKSIASARMETRKRPGSRVFSRAGPGAQQRKRLRGSDCLWERRFNDLVQFQEQEGHCKVPRGWKQNLPLCGWVLAQRSEYKKYQRGEVSKLNESQVKRLNDVGFVWTPLPPWEERYQELVQYRKENGHSNVPMDDPNAALAKWVRTQRSECRKMDKGQFTSITVDRFQALVDIEFVFDGQSGNGGCHSHDGYGDSESGEDSMSSNRGLLQQENSNFSTDREKYPSTAVLEVELIDQDVSRTTLDLVLVWNKATSCTESAPISTLLQALPLQAAIPLVQEVEHVDQDVSPTPSDLLPIWNKPTSCTKLALVSTLPQALPLQPAFPLALEVDHIDHEVSRTPSDLVLVWNKLNSCTKSTPGSTLPQALPPQPALPLALEVEHIDHDVSPTPSDLIPVWNEPTSCTKSAPVSTLLQSLPRQPACPSPSDAAADHHNVTHVQPVASLSWDHMFQELEEFKIKEGHLEVPESYHRSPLLPAWLRQQRKEYAAYQCGHDSTLTQLRVDSLTEIGVDLQLKTNQPSIRSGSLL